MRLSLQIHRPLRARGNPLPGYTGSVRTSKRPPAAFDPNIIFERTSGIPYRKDDPRILGDKLLGEELARAQHLGHSLYHLPDDVRRAKIPPAQANRLLEADTLIWHGWAPPKVPVLKAAVFDVDLTITADTLGKCFVDWFRAVKRIDTLTFAQILNDYRKSNRDFILRIALGAQVFARYPETLIQDLAHVFVRRVIASPEFNQPTPFIHPKAASRIQWHKDQGHIVLFASGSSYYVAKALADYLGADFAIGTRTRVTDKGIITTEVLGPRIMYDGKKEVILDLLRRVQVDPKNAWFYTDAWKDDRPSLEAIGRNDTRILTNYEWQWEEEIRQAGYQTMRFDEQTSMEDEAKKEAQEPEIRQNRKKVIRIKATEYLRSLRT